MSFFFRPLILALPLVTLAACETSVTPSYSTNPQNTVVLRRLASAGETARVATFTTAADVNQNPICRLAGPIDVGGGQTPVQALHDALTAELLAGGTYDDRGTPLTITLTKMDVNSMSGFWDFAATVASPKLPGGYAVTSRYDFQTSFSGRAACQNSALAFNKAAAAFINAIVSDPMFARAI